MSAGISDTAIVDSLLATLNHFGYNTDRSNVIPVLTIMAEDLRDAVRNAEIIRALLDPTLFNEVMHQSDHSITITVVRDQPMTANKDH